tara:strand:- start:1059 stop:1190 length:132 start_codon:yes stop_codon:yes gene_type:complete
MNVAIDQAWKQRAARHGRDRQFGGKVFGWFDRNDLLTLHDHYV